MARMQAAQVPEDVRPINIDAASKVLAEAMDYPWEHMPVQGRDNMRKIAATVIDAALTAHEQKAGE